MAQFAYQSRPSDAWKQREEQSGGGFIGFLKDSVTVYSPQKENWLRPLPPTWENPKHYGYDIWVHYAVGPQNAQVLCNLKMVNTQCSICEAYKRADDEGREDAYDFKPTRRVLVWFINRLTEDKDKDFKPVAWAMPWTLDRDVTKVCRDRQTGELYQIDHPEAGYDVSFDREGELPNVKYVGIQIARRPSPVDTRYLDFIVQNPLPNMLIKRTFEEVRALFEGQAMVATPAPNSSAAAQATPMQSLFTPATTASQQVAQAQPIAQQQPTQQQVFQQAQPQPQPVQQQICDKAIIAMNRRIGCQFILGHVGLCDYQIDYGPSDSQPGREAPVLTTQPVQQPQPTTQAQPTPSGVTPVSERTASFRQRFSGQ